MNLLQGSGRGAGVPNPIDGRGLQIGRFSHLHKLIRLNNLKSLMPAPRGIPLAFVCVPPFHHERHGNGFVAIREGSMTTSTGRLSERLMVGASATLVVGVAIAADESVRHR